VTWLPAPERGDTVPGRLSAISAGRPAPIVFVDPAGREDVTDVASLDAAARAVARRLCARGLARADRIAFIGFTTRAFVEALLGAWQLGATVTVLPIPVRQRDAAALRAQTWRLARSLRVRLVIADSVFHDLLADHDAAAPALLALDALASGDGATADDGPAPSDLALLQLTSGSSGPVKAVCLAHAALCANIDAIADAGQLTSGDCAVSWLPLYHDMGLIGGLLVPLVAGCAAVLVSPHVFMTRPAIWMELVSRRRGTLLVAPSFGYALAARTLDGPRALDLSSVRLALCGAERIVPADIARFLAAGQPHGLPGNVVTPCYGLAEASLAVTIAPPSRGMVVDRVARAALEHDRRAIPACGDEPGKEVVGLGRPVRGVAVRIIDDHGGDAAERSVGEVWVAGASLLAGYDIDGAQVAALDGGWLRTGDLGYLVAGELFVCGRDKDLIIVRGRNIWPEDVEHATESVRGVRRGNACAFAVDDDADREAIVIVAERARDVEPSGIAAAVLAAVTEAIGIAPRHVVVLEPSALPKTSSGKLRRPVTRASYLAGAFAAIDEAGAAPRPPARPGGWT